MELNFETITLNEILDITKRNLKTIIILPLITTIISFVLTFYIIQPKYLVYTKVFIGKEESLEHKENYNNDDVQMYLKLLKTYSEVVKTNKLVSKALISNNINLSSKEVLNNLSCTPTVDTQILEIKYSNSDKELAGKVVSAITNEFIQTSNDLIPNGTVKIVEDVIIPSSPVKPNKKLNLCIGFMIGFIMSIAIVFITELINNTFRNKEKLQRIIGVPVLGAIPDERCISGILPRSKKAQKHLSKNNNRIIMEYSSNSIVSEAYRILQTNIKYSSSEKIKTLLVTSAQLQEGKSTVVSNLALGFAEENIKVLLIDCDLRNPSIHKKFKLHNSIGLLNIIQEKTKLEDAIQRYNNNLYILTSGRASGIPASTLSSKSMNELLTRLKKEYDLIILDSAPVLPVTDSQILSTKVDGTLIVVRYGISKVTDVIECKNLLNMVGGNLIGTILHSTEINKNNNYSYVSSYSTNLSFNYE